MNAHMMPADQEKTSTPHFDLVMILKMAIVTICRYITTCLCLCLCLCLCISPCNCHGHHAQAVHKLASDVNRLCSKPVFVRYILNFSFRQFLDSSLIKNFARNLLTSLSRQKEQKEQEREYLVELKVTQGNTWIRSTNSFIKTSERSVDFVICNHLKFLKCFLLFHFFCLLYH